MFNNIEFASPAFLYLLLIIPLLTVWYVWKGFRNYGDVRVADSNAFGSTPSKSITVCNADITVITKTFPDIPY